MIARFESFEAARDALPQIPIDSRYFRGVSGLFELARRLAPLRCPHGIFRYESLEAAAEERKRLELLSAKKTRAARGKSRRNADG